MSIKRWQLMPESLVERSAAGVYVTYEDHAAEIARLTAEVERLRASEDLLRAGHRQLELDFIVKSQEIQQLRANNQALQDALQRAIAEAYLRWELSSERSRTADLMADILRPHATRMVGQTEGQKLTASYLTEAETEKAIDDICAKVAANRAPTVAQNATIAEPRRCCADCDPVFRQAYDLDGDTRDTLPPLPNSSATVTGSPVPTRELVARLAEVIKDWASLPEPVMHSCVPDVDAIIRDAKGGAE